jgi:DNA-binding NarL/FixJ family response regulator
VSSKPSAAGPAASCSRTARPKNCPPEDLVRDSAALERLTDREREVLRLLAHGKSNTELAQELYVGEGTIKTHVSSILAKLRLRDRVQAVVFAYDVGLVQPRQR